LARVYFANAKLGIQRINLGRVRDGMQGLLNYYFENLGLRGEEERSRRERRYLGGVYNLKGFGIK
jgi:hypothetical protein